MQMSSFAFLSDNAFMKAPRHDASRPYAVAGIAWDGSVTNRPGARMGPRAIREASHMLCDGIHPYFDTTPDGVLTDVGDLALPNTSLEAMRAAMMPEVERLLPRHHMAWLGGDHSITLPLLRAYRAWLGRPLAVIHFDAHCDTWEDHFGEPSGHGTWVYEAIAEGLVVKECFLQLGIHSAGVRAAREYVRDQGGTIHTARDLRGVESTTAVAALLAPWRERLRGADHPPVYLSLDIDCLDPAFAPGTGTPVCGGLSTWQAQEILRNLKTVNLVGADLVEVSPPFDHAEITALAGASLLLDMICLRAWQLGRR